MTKYNWQRRKEASYRKYLQNKSIEHYMEYKKSTSNSKENDTKAKKRSLGQIYQDTGNVHNRNTKKGLQSI
jgi:hypothetical protein